MIKNHLSVSGKVVKTQMIVNGSGIPDDIKGKVFDSFIKSKETGKGSRRWLFLVNQIIKDHNGSLTFTSVIDEGTSFLVQLPLVDTPKESVVMTKEKELICDQTLSILIAEDEEGIRDIFKYMFKKIGCNIKVVNNGREALSEFNKNSYDIILSDIQMPEMSGPELCAEIRSQVGIKQPKFLFISGGVNLYEKNIKDSQFDGFLEKPFHEQDLIKTINKVLK